MKRTKLLVVFAIATVGLLGALTTQAYAHPAYDYGACTECHAESSPTSLTVTLVSSSTTSATYSVVTGYSWAVYNGATKITYGTTSPGTFTVALGSTYTIYAVASTGGNTGNSTTVSPAAPVTTHTITASAGSNGAISPSGSVSVTDGGSQTFTITPNSGYVISDVLVDGTSVGAVSSYTLSNVTADRTISATFKVATATTHTIIASAGSNGAISPSGSVSVTDGGSQTFTITPDSGYQVADVLVDGESIGAATSHLFDEVTADHTISATFEPVTSESTHTITASAGLNGSISPSGDQEVTDGGSQTFTITPDSGYAISDVLVDGVSKGALSTYTFSDVTEDHTISASFEVAAVTTHTITASAGSNGAISPSGSVSVTDGGSQTFTITPNSGYVISDVLVDGTSVGAVSSYTLSNVTADRTISVTFKAATTVTTSLTIHRSGSSYKHGKSVTISGKLIGGLPSHTKVKLRVRRGTSGAYTYITGYTTSSGSYSFKKKLTNKGSYYFRVSYAGKTGYSSSTSSQLKVTSK